MKQEEISVAVEYLNKQYMDILSSKEYNLGRRIYKYWKLLKNLEFKLLIERIKYEKNELKVRKYSKSKSENMSLVYNKPINGKKGVVYTCITGKYDCLLEPLLIEDDVTYVVISDCEIDNKKSRWKRMDIPDECKNMSNTIINRYCKMNPFKLFSEYDYSIYIDGNVRVISMLSKLLPIAQKALLGIAIHDHPLRNCIYDEAAVCQIYKRGNIEMIQNQVKRYREAGFPEKFGLYEATIIVTDLKNVYAEEIFTAWWDEFCLSQSQRDQISLPFIVWNKGYRYRDIGCLGSDKRENPLFRLNGMHQIEQ